jgi:hypothetical protein
MYGQKALEKIPSSESPTTGSGIILISNKLSFSPKYVYQLHNEEMIKSPNLAQIQVTLGHMYIFLMENRPSVWPR